MKQNVHDDDLVMNLVEMALASPPEERETCLLSACGGDTQLLETVWEYVKWEQRMEGFLRSPLHHTAPMEHPFLPGDYLQERFRIVREVAQGGMGIVYEATDEKLKRRIALKCAKRGFGGRLPPEVRSATEISHPNVCKIFEIHSATTRDGEIDFLTMEFLDGETLSERIRRGSIAEEEKRAIAKQMAAGVAEAHRHKVIHGDLKSNNIILTKGPDGEVRVVITDFGLSHGPELPHPAARVGEVVGTPEYMAPELWEGAKISVASDIYALGVCLHELVYGRRPATTVERPAGTRSKWDGILQRCLHPDPVRRFRNADEVLKALAPSRARQWMAAGTAAAVLTIASGVVTYRTATAPEESVRLAFLPFETNPEAAQIGSSLSRDTAARLAGLRSNDRTELTVIPLDRALRQKVDTTQEAKTALNATHVLHGSLRREKGEVLLSAVLTDLRSMGKTREWKATYAPSEVRYVPVALAGVVTGAFRLPPAETAAVAAAARQDYLTGLAYLRRNSDIDRALPLLERAVAADPNSALTYAGLAEGQWWKYKISFDAAWRDRSEESLRQAERRNPDLAEVHRVGGLLKAESGWYEQATAQYQRAIELDPGNGDGYRRLGMALQANNQLDQALSAYLRAIELDPRHYRNHQALGAFYSERGDYEESVKQFRRAVELEAYEPAPHFALGSAYVSLGRFVEAEDQLRRAIELGETPTALNSLGVVLSYQGRNQEAIPYFERALSRWPEKYLWWMNLASSYRRLNFLTDAERAYRRGLLTVEAEMRKNPRSGYVRACLAYFYARLGDRARAESEVSQAVQLSPADSDARWMAVKTYEALGRREDTLAVLSASAPGVLADANRYPDLADLRKDVRFQKMLNDSQAK